MAVDFSVIFQSNASLVIAQMRQLEAQALRTQAVINQTAAASARTAAAAVGTGSGGAIGAVGTTAAAASPRVAALTKSLANLQAEMRAVSALGLAPTLAQTRREMSLLQQITAAGGPTFGRFNQATSAAALGLSRINPAAAASAAELIRHRAALDSTGAAFQRHVGRIQETILVYAAFAAAVAGAANAISLATTIDTESRRLEAVLDLTPQQGQDFVGGLFQSAVTTATPIEDILAESDLAASAFANLASEAERTAASQELLFRAGQVTTVTQRDMATETQNLIALLKLGNVEIGDLGTTLGQIVVAGDNSARSISAIFDALKVALPGADLAGVSLEQLIALIGEFRATTQRDGNSIGSTFATLFQTITQPEAQKRIKEITDGLLDVRDASGNLRPVIEILAELRALIDAGAVSAEKLPDIFKAFAPPLNPGAAKDVALIFDSLERLPAALREVETASASSLDGLVNKLNAALGPQFRILIEEIKQGFFELFGQQIIDAGQSLIGFMRLLGEVIHALPPELIQAVGQFIALAVALKGITFIGGSVISLLGLGGIAGAARLGNEGLRGMALAADVLRRALLRVLPLAVAVGAIEIGGNIVEDQEKTKILSDLGFSEAQTEFAVGAGREARFGGAPGEFIPGAHLLQESDLTSIQAENLNRLAIAIAQMRRSGSSTAEVEKAMAESIRDANGAINEQLVSIEDILSASAPLADSTSEQADALERLIERYQLGADASLGMTEAQRLEQETADLLLATRDAQAADLEKLAERLREGKISADEFAQGQQIVAQAAELAAQLVAVAGERLGQYPIFAAAAAEGNDVLTAKVYEMIVASGGSISAIGGLIGQLANLAAANATVADSLANNPLIITIGTRTIALKPGEMIRGRTRRGGVGRFNAAAEADSQIKAILDSINDLVSGFGTGSPAFGNIPSPSSSSRPSSGRSGTSSPAPGLLDIGDLPASQLAKAIAIAQRLQSAIPGGNERAKNEVLNIIKDAEFLRQVKGLDDQLLRKAIEELTDIERERLEEEKRKNAASELLRNLQVNVGPLGALISAPTLFGVGGSIPAGLNADPSKGNFVVNVPIELKGLEPAKLQQIIFDIVSRAIREGLRLQGA